MKLAPRQTQPEYAVQKYFVVHKLASNPAVKKIYFDPSGRIVEELPARTRVLPKSERVSLYRTCGRWAEIKERKVWQSRIEERARIEEQAPESGQQEIEKPKRGDHRELWRGILREVLDRP